MDNVWEPAMSEDQHGAVQAHQPPREIFERMIRAANRHDLDAMVGYFAPDFRSEQPLHPERSFTGPAGVRQTWGAFFATVPDLRVEIVAAAEDGDTVWAELRYHGTRTDEQPFLLRGVTRLGMQGDQIGWARVYVEPVVAAV